MGLLDMIRGSLYKTLHKNNQPLDIRRRLRMAIDVVRSEIVFSLLGGAGMELYQLS